MDLSPELVRAVALLVLLLLLLEDDGDRKRDLRDD
jgi:hypothetical protein